MLVNLASSLASLVSSRVYPQILPQNPTLPAITYQQVSAERVRNMLGRGGKVRLRITVNSWADTELAAHTLADSVKNLLDVPNAQIVLENEFETFEAEGGVTGIYRVAQDYLIATME
jgi:hypothetical protein